MWTVSAALVRQPASSPSSSFSSAVKGPTRNIHYRVAVFCKPELGGTPQSDGSRGSGGDYFFKFAAIERHRIRRNTQRSPGYRVTALFRYRGSRLKKPSVRLGHPGRVDKSQAQPMHSSVTGSALSRSVAIGRRHERQKPYFPDATRASARSTSPKCASACPRKAAVRSRSNAIVAPSGSCSSSPLVSIDAATISSNSAARARSRLSICSRSNSSSSLAAHAVVTASQ